MYVCVCNCTLHSAHRTLTMYVPVHFRNPNACFLDLACMRVYGKSRNLNIDLLTTVNHQSPFSPLQLINHIQIT